MNVSLKGKPSQQTWRSYEEVARHVLHHFADLLGISEVEAKQRLMGACGTQWVIDAKGVAADGDGFLVIECKERTNKRLDQDTIGALAFKVRDLAAKSAVIVTSVGLQKGAQQIAKDYNFHTVFLPKDQTFEEFVASCGNRIVRKCYPEKASASVCLVSATVIPPDKK